MNRTAIKEAMGGNSHTYRKIKAVCDFMNWHSGMSKKELTVQEKQELRDAAGKCELCGSTEKLTVDHIFPRSLGGTSEPENIQILCSTCNQKKSNRIVAQN